MRKEDEEQEEERTETETDSDSSLRKTVEFLSSLISLSHSTKVFAAKWQSIRGRLDGLASSLASLESCDGDSAVAAVVLSLMETVAECYDLARRCVDLSYSGKLLMQSDLDVIAARFDEHSRKLAEILDAGVLTRGTALVVSRPSFGACRDDMRFYVKDLVTRMKVGDSDMKTQALASLHSAVADDEKYVGVIAELGDIVAVIVNFLDSPESEIGEGSARLVSKILCFEAYKTVLVSAGVIAPLVRLLESGSDFTREMSAKCLIKVTENSDNAWSVSAHGGVTALLKICSDESSGGGLIAAACGVLRNLAGVEEIRRFMVEEKAVPSLSRLASSAAKDESAQVNSIELLRTLASADGFSRQSVIRDGGARSLLRVIEPRSNSTAKSRSVALQAIDSLFFSSSPDTQTTLLLENAFPEHLVFFLRSADVAVQEPALKLAAKLSASSEEAKRSLGEAGLMTELARLLESSKSSEVRELACEALLGMVSVPKNRKRFVQDDRNIAAVLQQLSPDKESSSAGKKLVLSLLISLTGSNSGRRKIAANGSLVRNVERLAEAEVSDAKKLVRKLSGGRFRSLISGILWH